MSDNTKQVILYTDGACSGNPGPGGWGALLMCKGAEKEFSGHAEQTTNNRMELTAVIEGLKKITKTSDVLVVTDSKYVLEGMTKWLAGWKKNGWKTASKKPVKNIDLWQALEAVCATHKVTFKWVKGHSNDPHNDRADALATQAIQAAI
jgi:ribonuclease HI